MSSKDASIIPELFKIGLYKPTQGKLVRQATVIAISVVVAFGCFRLSESMIGSDKALRLGLPIGIWAVLSWFAFRAVNFPRFADFLVAVESELERVVWPSWKQVWQSSIVVIVTMLFFGALLFFVDRLWRILFWLVSFIEYI